MGGGSSKNKKAVTPKAAAAPPPAPKPQPAPAPAAAGEPAPVQAINKKPSIISPPPNFKPAFKPEASASIAPPKGAALASVKGAGAFSVETLLKQAHEGIDLGKRAALLFDKFDADHNGILDNTELAELIKAMLQTTLATIVEANKEAVKKAIKARPQDEASIRSEAENEIMMIEPYAKAQIARAADIAVEMRREMDDNGDGKINKEEFIHEVTNCLKAYADFNVC